ncbi:hypothetical protein PoB_003349100 [Plakobranchus ocellatus]|uniref:Uncharacterized protein n=1 Tax=Plakobranchus ocellatus TaxID=259542 RepID=A0AAV4A6Z6_9GAST|nr:hypothetical protein PoB_003349100 [Plakobranchus ocellatus]
MSWVNKSEVPDMVPSKSPRLNLVTREMKINVDDLKNSSENEINRTRRDKTRNEVIRETERITKDNIGHEGTQ